MVITMCKLLTIRCSVEQFFKKYVGDYDETLEISHWEGLSGIKSVLEWPRDATLTLDSKNGVTVESNLKVFIKLLNRLRGIHRG